MAEVAEQTRTESLLDRTIDFGRISAWAWTATGVLLVAAAMRMARLGGLALSPDEAKRSFLALAYYDGRNVGNTSNLDTSPLLLIGQALSYFLFGVTDTTARLFPALAGIGIVALALALRPFVGSVQSIGMAVVVTLSPTLAYSSRVVSPEILVAFCSLLAVVALFYAGRAAQTGGNVAGWSVLSGAAVAASLASGPSSITVLLAIGAGLLFAALAETGDEGAVRRGFHALTGNPASLLALAAGFGVTLLLLFSRGFSSLSSLSGIPETFRDGVRIWTTETSATPTQIFLLAVLLYELLALAGAICGSLLGIQERPGGLGLVFFLGWFIVALIAFSFSAGKVPEFIVHLSLPIALMGGAGAASVLASLGWHARRRQSTVLLVASVVALIIVLAAFVASLGRIPDALDETRAALEAAAVLIIAVIPISVALFVQLTDRSADESVSLPRLAGASLAAALLVFGFAYELRATAMLNYLRADTSLELAAQRTSTPAVEALVRQVRNLSRDLTVRETSSADPTGGHGISISIESPVQWPFRWYFRDFPGTEIVEAGTGPRSGADLVIAREQVDMDTAGYTPRLISARNRIPPEYLTPSFGSVLSSIFVPSEWERGARFLLFREGITRPDPEPVAVGYGQRLAQKLFPSTGPYGLSERVGTGSGRGQFNQPRDIGVNMGDGSIYVVDSVNGRVQRFDPRGEFIGSWGGPESPIQFAVTAEGLGPTGITVGFDGLVYVADTWNHQIVVINPSGQVVRTFGEFGDTSDSPAADSLPGMFFGPRDVAVTASEIFVVDTGNERVQVFTPDGTFVRAWGGYGSGPSQFIEPVGIAAGPDDRIYVADSGNGRISVFARDGTPLAQWPVAAWQGQIFFEPYLAFDRFGQLFVTSSSTGIVEVYDLNGQLITSLDNAGGEPFENPVGIAQGLDGTMLVSDRGIASVLSIPIMPPPLEPEATPVASPVASPAAAVATPEV